MAIVYSISQFKHNHSISYSSITKHTYTHTDLQTRYFWLFKLNKRFFLCIVNVRLASFENVPLSYFHQTDIHGVSPLGRCPISVSCTSLLALPLSVNFLIQSDLRLKQKNIKVKKISTVIFLFLDVITIFMREKLKDF